MADTSQSHDFAEWVKASSNPGNQQARPYRPGLLMRAGLPCGWLALICQQHPSQNNFARLRSTTPCTNQQAIMRPQDTAE